MRPVSLITKAVKIALRQHQLAGNPSAVEQAGKVVVIPADEILEYDP